MSVNTEEFLRHKGGIEKNDLTKIINIDLNESSISIKSKYHNVDDLKTFLKRHTNKLTILSLNIDSLSSKIDELNILISTLAESDVQINVICIQEARIRKNTDTQHLNLKNYTMTTQASTDRCSKKGGLVTYVSNNITISNSKAYNTYSTWEALCLDIVDDSNKKITICNIYRPPKNNNNHASIDLFMQEFNPVLLDINKDAKNVVLTGDFNIDLLKLNSNEKFQEFYDTLTKIDLLPVITLPTRMSARNATLIDQIYCKSSNPLTIADSGILAAKISDHMAIFAALNFNINKTYTVTDKISMRSFTGRNIDSFTNKLEDINWHQVFDHNPTADPLISYDDKFSTKLEEVMNNHFPLKDVKFNKYKHKKSKWMTYELLAKIKKRDKLYLEVHMTSPNSNINNDTNFQFTPVSENDTKNIINNLKSKRSMGIDNISSILLKASVNVIAKPLTSIINQSLLSGKFPQKLKIAKVIPIHKKDDNHIFNNYRPISLLPCISKVFEKIVYTQLFHYLTLNKLLHPNQYGFRAEYSTELAISELVDRIYLNLDKKVYHWQYF